MKAGIIGAGALGSLFAHKFQRAGISYSILEKDSAVVDEINNNGLTLIDSDTSDIIHPLISTNPAIISDADIILFFVKSYSTSDAVESIRSYIRDDSIIVSLQNGLGNFESIAEYFDKDRIVLGTTTTGATKTGPASVRAGGEGVITIGSSSADSLETADILFSKACQKFNRIFNPHIAVWKKAVLNSGINPIASIMNISNGEILENPYCMKLQEQVVMEAVNTANSAGISLSYNSMLSEVRDVCIKTSTNICSMLQDIKSKRKTEIDSINGAIIKTASDHNLNVPVTETLYNIVKGIELKNVTMFNSNN
ncbi:MAG TPA: 2-dehydropantoate 2-reductase [Spirochaetota bacterium]|nr:2-dehydropantoate 2-reductase [Spirochaetota bacterium]HPJ33653.1 2-dehydropantoate 2-reductase [Spirochaetota bacterium]